MKRLTNTSNIPISLAVWLATDDYDHDDRTNHISTTSLLKPLRELLLLRQHKDLDKVTDISSLIASRIGTAIHDSIERSWTAPGNVHKCLELLGYPKQLIERVVVNPSKDELASHPNMVPVFLEQRTEKEIAGFIVSGKFDFVIEAGVQDFKTTGTYGYMTGSNTQKYMEQGSIYRWLNPEHITGDTVKIQLIFTDWSALSARQSRDYPQSKIMQQEIPLMTIEETESFIRHKLELVAAHEAAPHNPLPLCSREELWQKSDVWKYYKNPEKKARSTKNFDTLNEATIRLHDDGNVGEIVMVNGKVMKCNYCDVREVCEQATDLANVGLL